MESFEAVKPPSLSPDSHSESDANGSSFLGRLIKFAHDEQIRTAAWSPSDDISHLSLKERQAWAGLLASIATSEATEEKLLTPLQKTFAFEAEITDFLRSHSADEARHLLIMRRYLQNSFQHVKRHKTLTDRLIYEGVLPMVTHLGRRRPRYILAIVQFFEVFSVPFYGEVRLRAQARGLGELVELFAMIERDERRHVGGIGYLLKRDREIFGPTTWYDIVVICGVLSLFLLDINASRWALYNQRMRRNVCTIGLDPKRMNREALATAKKIFSGFIEK